MKRNVLWLLLVLSLLFNVSFIGGYLRAEDQTEQPVADQVAEELGLNEEQKELYGQLRASMNEERAEVDKELAVVEFELLSEMRGADADADRVRELMDREVELRHRRGRIASERFGRFLKTLSAEQRRELCGRMGRRHPDRKRREREILKRFDANGDGKLAGDEWTALRAYMTERKLRDVTEQFDADGDGELNDEERQAAQAFIEEQRKERMQRGGSRGPWSGSPRHRGDRGSRGGDGPANGPDGERPRQPRF